MCTPLADSGLGPFMEYRCPESSFEKMASGWRNMFGVVVLARRRATARHTAISPSHVTTPDLARLVFLVVGHS